MVKKSSHYYPSTTQVDNRNLVVGGVVLAEASALTLRAALLRQAVVLHHAARLLHQLAHRGVALAAAAVVVGRAVLVASACGSPLVSCVVEIIYPGC